MLPVMLIAAWFAVLVTDPPSPGDVVRFPPLEVCQERYRAAEAHLGWLKAQQWFDSGTPAEGVWEAWETDARARMLVWEAACSARQMEGSPTWAQTSLAWLRHLLGENAYYAGEMPSPVPLWRVGR